TLLLMDKKFLVLKYHDVLCDPNSYGCNDCFSKSISLLDIKQEKKSRLIDKSYVPLLKKILHPSIVDANVKSEIDQDNELQFSIQSKINTEDYIESTSNKEQNINSAVNNEYSIESTINNENNVESKKNKG